MTKDRFAGSIGQSSPIFDGFSIAPNDSADVSEITRAIVVSTLSDVSCELKSGNTVTFPSLVPGVIYPLRIKRVLDPGTTATGILGLV